MFHFYRGNGQKLFNARVFAGAWCFSPNCAAKLGCRCAVFLRNQKFFRKFIEKSAFWEFYADKLLGKIVSLHRPLIIKSNFNLNFLLICLLTRMPSSDIRR